MHIGAVYEYSNVRPEKNGFLDQMKPYGVGQWSAVSFSTGCSYDTRDGAIAPSRGFFLKAAGTFYPKLFGNQLQFGKASADLRTYIPASFLTDITFALRIGGEKTFGTYPFFHSSILFLY